MSPAGSLRLYGTRREPVRLRRRSWRHQREAFAARIEDGSVVARLQQPTDPGADLEAQVETLAAMLAELGYRHGDLLGVAAAGRVDVQGNWHAVNSDTLRAISAAPLGSTLRRRFGPRSSLGE